MDGTTPISKGDYSVELRGPQNRVIKGSFYLEDLGGSCKLTLRFEDKTLSAMSSDFFDALAQIRRRLEKEEIFPFCYGASRHVFPSNLSRAMAKGLMVPRWERGKLRGELVFIFHSGPDVEPTTVAEQREFRQRWIAENEGNIVASSENNSGPKLAA